ncbi:LLM class flavin-dependent oxidoreductase [Kineosporia babensis]|uniref:LLM class flavin-dependent oxidoreductase n=1 Tax=Kineosporia babensis TaxID=499548 RepID=A0A9X1SSK4_9ACTN|nr:LLM class flavin-dependent oxidoreductase [Kineosporia babensis]MCD5310752.1 LLM class flavin-dependent oxidoreductase [Kineosporia babensis]
MPKLSVLDMGVASSGTTVAESINDIRDLARTAERFGYERYWVAEHHGVPAFLTSATAVLIQAVAAATSTIRVGAGGIMLPNHASLLVAENFGTLETLHPGRIDLGLGSGVGGPGIVKELLRTRPPEDYEEQLTELLAYFRPGGGKTRMPLSVRVAEGHRPQIWGLGSSSGGARRAATHGLPFVYAQHLNADGMNEALRVYREEFRPSKTFPEPYVMVCVSVVCADSDEQAQFLAGPAVHIGYEKASGHQPGPLPTPEEVAAAGYPDDQLPAVDAIRSEMVVGSPGTVGKELDRILTESNGDELMITTSVHAVEDRVRSLELLSSL